MRIYVRKLLIYILSMINISACSICLAESGFEFLIPTFWLQHQHLITSSKVVVDVVVFVVVVVTSIWGLLMAISLAGNSMSSWFKQT